MSHVDVDRDISAALDALPIGYSQSWFDDRRAGNTLRASLDSRHRWLYAEALDGSDQLQPLPARQQAGFKTV